MANHRLQTSKEIPPLAKRKRVLAAVAQDITSGDDDNVTDTMDICDIIENHKESATSHALHALGETIRNTLLEINEIREQNRERRHKELLGVLTKMTQHENADSEKSEMVRTKMYTIDHIKEEDINSTFEKNANGYISKENVLDKQPSHTSTISKSKNSTTLRQQELHQMTENTSIIETTNKSTNVSSVHIVPANNSISTSPILVGTGQVNAVEGTLAVKQDSKEELQKMRARMLELQRKKMEDRERKKRNAAAIAK